MAKRFVRPSTPHAPYIPPGPGAERGRVVTFFKLLRSNPKQPVLLEEIDVEVRTFGPKDYRAKAAGSMLGEGIYKDAGLANEAVRTYIAKMKNLGWTVMNERKDYSLSG